jgi:hypothetical protein
VADKQEKSSERIAQAAEAANVPQAAVTDAGEPARGSVTAAVIGKTAPNEQAKVEVRGLRDAAGNELPAITFDPANNDGVPADASGTVPQWALDGLVESLVPMAVREEDRTALIERYGPKRASRAAGPRPSLEGDEAARESGVNGPVVNGPGGS